MGHGDRFLVPSSVLSVLSNCLKGWDKEPVPVSHLPVSYYIPLKNSIFLAKEDTVLSQGSHIPRSIRP